MAPLGSHRRRRAALATRSVQPQPTCKDDFLDSEKRYSPKSSKRASFAMTGTLIKVLGTLTSLLLVGILVRKPSSTSNQESSNTRQHRVAHYDTRTNTRVSRTILMALPTRRLERQRLTFFDRDPIPRIDWNDPDYGEAIEVPDSKDRVCRPMAAWQTQNYHTCNKMHELIMDDKTKFLSCGNSRCTILYGDLYQDVVLKVMNIETESYSKRIYNMASKDSLAMEKLTSSPYIIDIYGACAVTQIVEYSSGGNLHDLLKRQRIQEEIGDSKELGTKLKEKRTEEGGHFGDPARYKRHQLTSPVTKLKIAYQVATAVADMHAVEEHPDGLPSLVNNDLCCHQFNIVNGVYKLGDFDWSTLMSVTTSLEPGSVRGKKTKDIPCQTTPIAFAGDYLKQLSPEELVFYEYDDMEPEQQEQITESEWERRTADFPEPGPIAREKLDVFQIGTITYHLLTNWWIWEGYTTAHAIIAGVQGAQSSFPDDLYDEDLSSKDLAAVQALKKVVLMAWSHDPEKRPTSRYISNHLRKAIRDITGEDDDEDMVRVSIPPLPSDHRFSDTDFNVNLAK